VILSDVTVAGASSNELVLAPGNTAAQNSALIQAALAITPAIYIAGGTYPVNDIQIFNNYKVLSADTKKIYFVSPLVHIFYCAGTYDAANFEFHGILESTWVGPLTADTGGLIRVLDHTCVISDWNIDDCEFISLTGAVNGVSFFASENNGGIAWIKNISAKNCKYTCGRIGFETNNHEDNLVISGVTIGSAATFTVDSAKIREGQTVMLQDIVGTGLVSQLNESFYLATNITATTFQLKSSSGALVSTVGGTYASGGIVYVYRIDRLDLSGSKFYKSNAYPSYGMGVSLSGFNLDCNLSDISGWDNVTCIIENIGGSGIYIDNLKGYNCSGDLVQMTNIKRMYNNTVSNCKTVGRSARGMTIGNQRNFRFTNNVLHVTSPVTLNCTNSIISGCHIKSSVANECLQMTGGAGEGPGSNNYIFDCIFDNSEQSYVGPPVTFGYGKSQYNIMERITYKTAGVLTNPILEWGDVINGYASGNVINNWRYADSIGWRTDVSQIVQAFGLLSTLGSNGFSDTKTLTVRDAAASGLRITNVIPDAQNGQPHLTINIDYVGRSGNNIIGGSISCVFNSYDQPLNKPILSFTGSGASPTKSGQAVLVAGQLLIANADHLGESTISLRNLLPGGTPGALFVSAREDYVSFTIKSTNAADTSTVLYDIVHNNPPTISYGGVDGSGKNYWNLIFPSHDVVSYKLSATANPSDLGAYSITEIA
jgi:hypothetical protein